MLANELVEPEPELFMLELDELGMYELEFDEEELLALPPLLRTRLDMMSTSMSMKVSSGLVTIALL